MSNYNIFFLILPVTFLFQRQLLATASCIDAFQIRDCREDDGTEKILTFYRIKANQLIANFETDCTFDSVTYKWSIYDSSHDEPVIDEETNNSFVIAPFSLKKDIYGIILTPVLIRNGADVDVIQATCGFKMEALDPIPVIDGGSKRTVEANHKFVVDGSKSIDRDVPPTKTGKLAYLWKCKLLEGEDSGFCTKEHEGTTLEVPQNHAKINFTYLFTLSVRSQDSTTWASSEQTVLILTDVVVLKIICEKNCPPAAAFTDSQHLTFLRVKCLENCRVDDEYKWSVDGNFDYDSKTQFGRNTAKFVIKGKSLENGKNYSVSVEVKNRKGGASCLLTVGTPIKIKSCQVKPPEGVGLETRFTVGCNYTGVAYTFEVFTVKNRESTFLTKTHKLNEINVLLSPNSDLYIKIEDIDGFQDVHHLNVVVKPLTKNVSTFLESLQNLVSQGNADKVIQTTNAIIEAIDTKTASEKAEIKNELVKSLQNLSLVTEDDARHITAIVTRVVNDPSADSNPYQGEVATQMCKKSSEILLTSLGEEYYPTTLTNDALETTKLLTKCGEIDSTQNFKMLEPEPLDFEITTPFPVLEVPVIVEDYPDYETDTSVTDKKLKYQTISNNVVDICENSLKMLGLTVVEGEETLVTSSSDSAVEVTRLLGKDFMETQIEIQTTFFSLSGDFHKSLEVVDVMMCSWKRDPFWWNPEKRAVVTNVVLVKVKSTTEISKFNKPNIIVFKMKTRLEENIHEIINQTVLRIVVKPGESFVVHFLNVETTTVLHALVTNFRKPEPEEVMEDGIIISETENVMYQMENNKFDSWYYLTVIPEAENVPFKFWVSVFTKSCYTWNSTQKAWRFGCGSELDELEVTIKCPCTHLSILAGVMYNNPVRVDVVLTQPEFEIVLINSFVVIISVATTFGIYCVVLVVTNNKLKSYSVFLPADVSVSSRYVYLVAIRTGRKPSSGTSSNICVQVFGDTNKSECHVLNFPDPQQRILQRGNTDWFIIPTLFHLGKVTEIALWSDHSGRHPRWFCLDVTVYDLQRKKKWYFNVNRWFDLHQLQASVTSSVKRSREIIFRFWPKRTLQEGFSGFAKLTLMMSGTLGVFLFCLVLHGLPTVTLKDGFTHVQNYSFDPETVWIGVASSVLAFGCHLVMTCFFRKFEPLSWFLLFCSVTSTLAILVVYGFWVPTMEGYFWLTSAVIGVVVYVFILENLLDFALNFFMTKPPRWDKNPKKLLEAIEEYRTYLFRQFGGDLLRPYFESLYQPLGARDIKERQYHLERRKKLLALLEDTFMFICYVTLLYSAIFANKNPMTIPNHYQILDLLSGKYLRRENYDTASTIPEIFSYINNTLIPSLHSSQWYGKYVVHDPGMMADFHNKFLGVARLRQRRVVLRPCNPSSMVPRNNCKSEAWFAPNSKQHFGLDYNNFDRLTKVWNYTDSKEAGISIHVGKFGIYYGGGFVAPLGRTLYNSYANLLYLSNHSWLDGTTSVVIIEFLAYNVNTNLFNVVKMVFERSVTGYVHNVVELSTAQFLFVQDEEQIVQRVIFGSFILIVFIFTVKFFVRLWEGKLLVLKDLWTFLDLLIVALSYTCFTVFIHRSKSVKVFLDRIEHAKKNEFINYFHLLYEETVFTLIAAFLVFVATIRLWKMCRFGTVFRIMERTIILSFASIFHVFILHMIAVSGFAISGYLVFGTEIESFRNVPNSFVSLLFLMIGMENNFDLDGLLQLKPTSGRLYYSMFMLLTMWFLTIYICVLMMFYYKAQTTSDTFQTIRDFVYNEYHFYKTSFKMNLSRLKGGTEKPFITPKSNELRYADCLTLSAKTLEMMRCIMACKLKRKMTKSEKIKRMGKIVHGLFSKDRIDIFFSLKEKGYIKIIHDSRIEMIAAAAEAALNYDVVRNREKENIAMERMMRKLDFVQQMLDVAARIVSNIEVE